MRKFVYSLIFQLLSIMRVYEQLQRRMNVCKEREEYSFRVEAGDVKQWGEWVLAGVVFNDADEDEMDEWRLADFYVYHFRQGFQKVSLKSIIQDKSFTIILKFTEAETDPKIPDFKDGGNYFFSHILETVTRTFDNKFYEE